MKINRRTARQSARRVRRDGGRGNSEALTLQVFVRELELQEGKKSEWLRSAAEEVIDEESGNLLALIGIPVNRSHSIGRSEIS